VFSRQPVQQLLVNLLTGQQGKVISLVRDGLAYFRDLQGQRAVLVLAQATVYRHQPGDAEYSGSLGVLRY
jgi:hypothetical protein